MISLKPRRRSRVTLPLTALIDIVFLLLIYFLLTSSFIQREGLRLSLPEAESGKPVKPEVTLYVNQEGEILFKGRKWSKDSLVEALRQELTVEEEKTVTVEADRRAPLEAVVSAMDAARLAGAQNLNLATERPSQP